MLSTPRPRLRLGLGLITTISYSWWGLTITYFVCLLCVDGRFSKIRSHIFLRKVRISPKVTIACNGFCLLRHAKAWFAHDIISLIQWHDVFVCTLLHRELRDYSLGQIAFVFFKRYLLSHSCFVM